MENNRISVIVPTYRRKEYLEKCINSLISQTRKPDEVVFVIRPDDEESAKLLTEFEKKQKGYINFKVVNVTEEGVVPAENVGLLKSSGEIICLIDDDGIAPEDWIEKMVLNFKNPDVGAVGGPIISYVDNKPVYKKSNDIGRILWYGAVIGNMDKIPDKPLYVDHLGGCNMAFRRDLVDKIDDKLIGHGYRFEMDICLNIREKGYSILFDPNLRVYHLGARSKDVRKMDLKNTYESNHNNTYVLLKYLPLHKKVIFLFYTLLAGFLHIGEQEGRAKVMGRLHGILTYIRYRIFFRG